MGVVEHVPNCEGLIRGEVVSQRAAFKEHAEEKSKLLFFQPENDFSRINIFFPEDHCWWEQFLTTPGGSLLIWTFPSGFDLLSIPNSLNLHNSARGPLSEFLYSHIWSLVRVVLRSSTQRRATTLLVVGGLLDLGNTFWNWRQIHFSIWDKYILQFETNIYLKFLDKYNFEILNKNVIQVVHELGIWLQVARQLLPCTTHVNLQTCDK